MVARAKEGFSTAGDMARVKDCLYLLARLYYSLQLTQERNVAAGQYKKVVGLRLVPCQDQDHYGLVGLPCQ